MKVVIFTVCRDAAVVQGRLNIREAFAYLNVPAVPVRTKFTIATRLFFPLAEKGQFSGYISLLHPDGREAMRTRIEFDVPILHYDSKGIYIDSVGEFVFTVRSFGEHQFHIARNGTEPHIFSLFVSQE